MSLWHLHLQQLVSSFLKSEGVHDREVDRSSKIDEVGLCHVGDPFLVGCCRLQWAFSKLLLPSPSNASGLTDIAILFSIRRYITPGLFILILVVRITQDLSLDFSVFFFVRKEVGVRLEDICVTNRHQPMSSLYLHILN